mgnify:CR=1 FL=1
MESGGGGLVSTMDDYHRFCSAIVAGGELDGRRVLGDRTVRQMMTNHLPGAGDLDDVGDPLYAPGFFIGCGFGLGFATGVDPARGRLQATRGEASWGGAASTVFWVDPVEGERSLEACRRHRRNRGPFRAEHEVCGGGRGEGTSVKTCPPRPC